MRKVVISPSYGAGWYTWNSELGAEILFDEGLVALVESRELEKAEAYAKEKWPSAYVGGLKDAEVIQVSGEFIIDEYDGFESIILKNDTEWF